MIINRASGLVVAGQDTPTKESLPEKWSADNAKDKAPYYYNTQVVCTFQPKFEIV